MSFTVIVFVYRSLLQTNCLAHFKIEIYRMNQTGEFSTFIWLLVTPVSQPLRASHHTVMPKLVFDL